MSNHVHMQVFSLDCGALTHFHERLKKGLADFLKRLLGLSQLHLWDNHLLWYTPTFASCVGKRNATPNRLHLWGFIKC